MLKCEHIKSFKYPETSKIFAKLSISSCELCWKKDDLFISLPDLKLVCKNHSETSSIKIKKENLSLVCSNCHRSIPLEKSPLREIIFELKKSNKSIRTLGCTGLTNLGNTCYINSIIQLLSQIVCIKKYFLNYVSTKEIYGLLKEFCNVLSSLWQGSRFYEPKILINCIDFEFSSQQNLTQHQDTLEFFQLLYNLLDKQLQTQLGNSFISDIFTWSIKNTIKCMKCLHKSDNTEKLLEMPLCIPRNNDIQNLRTESSKMLTNKDKQDLKYVTNSVWKKVKQ